MSTEKTGELTWCGYHWTSKMEGGRIIHPKYPHAWYSSAEEVVTRMRNGELHLSYRKNPKTIHHWDGKTYEPTMERALIRTCEHFSYGTFSIEAIVPKGLNVGCACWLSGAANWPPEIDILETFTNKGEGYLCNRTNYFPWLCKSWRTTYNVHYNERKCFSNKLVNTHLGSKNIRLKDQPLDPSENWIKYECIWEPDKITFKVNDVVIKVVGKRYANMFTKNIRDPEKGFLLDFIIDVNVDDPKVTKTRLDTPLKVRNFRYEPLEQ